METYIVYTDHLYGGLFAVLQSEVKAYDEAAENDDEDYYYGYYGYCDQCGDSDYEVGELISDHDPTQNELEEFARKE